MTWREAQPVVFDSAVEGLVRALGNPLPAHLHGEFERAGMNPSQLVPAYPLEQFEALILGLSRILYAQMDQGPALRALGRRFLNGFVETTVGKALLLLARALGPQRALSRMGRNFKSAGNAVEITTVVRTANEVEMSVAIQACFLAVRANLQQPMVEYRAGILEATLALLGCRGCEVKVVENDPVRQLARYRVTWE